MQVEKGLCRDLSRPATSSHRLTAIRMANCRRTGWDSSHIAGVDACAMVWPVISYLAAQTSSVRSGTNDDLAGLLHLRVVVVLASLQLLLLANRLHSFMF